MLGLVGRLQETVSAEIERDIHMGLGLTVAVQTGDGTAGMFGGFDQGEYCQQNVDHSTHRLRSRVLIWRICYLRFPDGVFGGLSLEDNVFASFEAYARAERGGGKDSMPYRGGSRLESLVVQPAHETLFVEGLSPLRDRYLSSVFQQLTAPVHLMFPQVRHNCVSIEYALTDHRGEL